MKQLRRLFAPTLLIAALCAPLVTTEAQQGGRRQRGRMTRQVPGAGGQQIRPTPSATARQGATEPAQRVGRRRYGRRGKATTTQHQTLDAADQTTDSTQSTSAQQGATEQTYSASQGRRGRRGRRDATTASDTTPAPGQQSQASKPKVTVLRKLNQARLSAAAIKTIRSMALLRHIVAVRGHAIRPLAGSSLWQLSNGGYLVVGGSTAEPEVHASQMITWPIGENVMVWACYCPQYDANKDDGCKFDGSAGPLSCKQMGGVNCSCKFEDFLIMFDGSVLGFEGPAGD